MDDVDIWPAGMLETSEKGPGPLFRAIIKNQFIRIRHGDRFWFENYEMNKYDTIILYSIEHRCFVFLW